MNNKKLSRIFMAFCMILTTTIISEAQGGRSGVRRVQFPRGRTTVVLKGVLRGQNDFTYVVRASRGQTLIAHLTVRRGEYASLIIEGPRKIRLTNAQGEDAADDYEVQLPATGDYKIVVFPPDTAYNYELAHYTLEVTIR